MLGLTELPGKVWSCNAPQGTNSSNIVSLLIIGVWVEVILLPNFAWRLMKATHCHKGHEFTPETTYVTPSTGKRYCKICKNAKYWGNIEAIRKRDTIRMRKWRAENKEHANKLWTELRKTKRAYLTDYKSEHPCIKCGEKDPACLDFHHRDPKEKAFTLSLGIARASLERLQKEVAKCDILCANCHRKLHASEHR